jgi:hypothetical protein
MQFKFTTQVQKFGTGYSVYLNSEEGGSILQVQHPRLDVCLKFVSEEAGPAIAEALRKLIDNAGGVL